MSAVYRKEMRQYFHSVIGYVFLAIFLFINAFYFLLQNLLLNCISRPHFIAYDHTQMQNLSYRAAVKLLHAVPVAWTVRSEEEFYRNFDSGIDIQIFEGFLPPAILEEGDPDDGFAGKSAQEEPEADVPPHSENTASITPLHGDKK